MGTATAMSVTQSTRARDLRTGVSCGVLEDSSTVEVIEVSAATGWPTFLDPSSAANIGDSPDVSRHNNNNKKRVAAESHSETGHVISGSAEDRPPVT